MGRAKVNIKTSKGNMQAIVDGFDVLEELTKDDTIISIDVLEGIENLKLNA